MNWDPDSVLIVTEVLLKLCQTLEWWLVCSYTGRTCIEWSTGWESNWRSTWQGYVHSRCVHQGTEWLGWQFLHAEWISWWVWLHLFNAFIIWKAFGHFVTSIFDVFILSLTGKPKQQRFTIQNGALTSIKNGWCGTINCCPLPEQSLDL